MNIPFTKLQGAHNDFILTPIEHAPEEHLLAEIAVAICHRYTGVGADGWMLIDAAPTEEYEAQIRLFNSDGSEPELSGNGTRCAAALISRQRPELTEFRILTGAGLKHLKLISSDELEYLFEMNMGQVEVLDRNANIQGLDAILVNPGNPQCAFPVEDFDFDWPTLGEATEFDEMFPDRTNVSFFKRVDEHTIEARFWERGAGETMSSGTGSTGAVKAALELGWVSDPVTVLTPAGPLWLRVAEDESILLTGPAAFVADGEFYLP